jgi:hypothetical protein
MKDVIGAGYVTVEPSSYQMALRRLLLQPLLWMPSAALRRYLEQSAGAVSPRQMPRTKARSVPLPRAREAKPVGAAADGSTSSSATTLDQNVLLKEEDDDGEGAGAAGEGAIDDLHCTNVQSLSMDVTTVQRLATMAKRIIRHWPWRWTTDLDDGIGCTLS